MTSFWSWYITVLTLGAIFALTWLLLDTRKGQRSEQTDEKVGHAYDGIEEYVMRKATGFRVDFGEMATRLYDEAWSVLSMTKD